MFPTVAQLSVAVAVPVLAGGQLASHSIVKSAGHVIIGAVVSVTVIIWSQEDVLAFWSVAVQVLVITELFPVPATTLSV